MSMNINRKTEIAEKILASINGWISSADQKVSIFLALEGVIITLLIPNYLKSITDRFQTHTMQFWPGALIILTVLSLGYSIFRSLTVIFPRLTNKACSHLYFGCIKNMDFNKFSRDMERMSENSYLKELYEQIHTNSKIANCKHEAFQHAIVAFIVGMLLCMVSYILLKTYV